MSEMHKGYTLSGWQRNMQEPVFTDANSVSVAPEYGSEVDVRQTSSSVINQSQTQHAEGKHGDDFSVIITDITNTTSVLGSTK